MKNILNLIPTIQAASLATENIKVAKNKPKTKDMVNLGLKNIVGIEVIKIESNLIAGL